MNQPAGFDPVGAANEIQQRAAQPSISVALRASAGAGKTKVLVDRFLRLCIEEGPGRAHPRSILAITFTRKAAVEIQERLLERARELALADEERLPLLLRKLFAGRADPAPSAGEMAAAANLLELVLEDVSGLNVGTIHSFCQLILGRFAAEAGLDPHFSVLENQDELIDEALEALEREMAAGPDLRAAAATVGRNPSSVRSALRAVLPEQMRLGRWLAAHGASTGNRLDHLDDLLGDLRAFLFPDLTAGHEPDLMDFRLPLAVELEGFVGPGVDAITAAMGADLALVKPKKLEIARAEAAEVAAALRALDPLAADAAAVLSGLVESAQRIFLKQDNHSRTFTDIRKDVELKERYNAMVCEQALGVLGVLHRLGYVELYRLNRDLLRLALRLFDIYDELKRRDRVVDFQDLEDMACRLMGDEGSVGALLFRLDDSLNHILLDEFQDTNFNQWDTLRPFVDEFLSTRRDDRARTVFFVGDVKQSIYGFRGAEPDIFTNACALLSRHELPVENLPTNFRSLRHLVAGVGAIFSTPPLCESLSDEEREHVQQAWARNEATGEVLILDPFAPPDDGGDPRNGDQLAACAAAQLVRRWREDPAEVAWEGFGDDLRRRPLRWDDFLVLTRSRTEISLYEKAFRDEGIPFVPPGRGMLAASREVQDILALLRWLLWPDDDASLATVLRCPLFRVPEADFQRLLAARDLFRPGDEEGRFRPPHNLWPTLRKAMDQPAFARPGLLLSEWRKQLGFGTCHDLLRRIFREGDVLERYRQARGEQAVYNLMRLYDVALMPEVAGTPTVRRLTEFLTAAAGRGGQEEGTLPRSAGDGRVRIMTVHAAKGLEAPIVLLVDADRSAGAESPRVRVAASSPDTPLLFKVTKAYREGFGLPDGVAWPQDPLQRASAAARRRDEAEEANLLYVAMTRARDRLVVLGGDRKSGTDHDSPLRQIRRSLMQPNSAPLFTTTDPPGLSRPPEPPAMRAAAGAPEPEPEPGDEIRVWTSPTMRETMKVVTPSGTPAPADEEGPLWASPAQSVDDDSDPTERGHRVHLLLQLAAEAGAMPPGDSAHHREAGAVFGKAAFDRVFRPHLVGAEGLSEVPVIQRRTVPGPDGIEERVTGVIDRLVVGPDSVDIIDYKTNRFGGDERIRSNLIAHYEGQLDTYRESVAVLYPGRRIRCWLLFTEPGLDDALRLAEVGGR